MAVIFGPFGPGACVDQGLQGVMNLLDSVNQLYNPNVFLNPQAANILNMVTGRDTVWNGLNKFILGPPPLSGPSLVTAQALSAALDDFLVAKNGFEHWTNYLSGKVTVFPVAQLADMFNYFGVALPAQWPLLAGFGFVGLMGLASGATRVDYALCKVHPDDPCALINNIFAAILNAGTFLLNTIIAGFNTMVNFAGNLLNYLAQVAAFIDDLLNMILEGINKVLTAIMEGLRYALAKLFDALKFDPCLLAIMNNICGTDLKAAIGI